MMKRTLLSILVTCLALGAFAAPNIGDMFAFAGLESQKLVPDFAKEISETSTIQKGENPKKDAIYLYAGDKVDVITPAQLNNYFATIFSVAQKAADDGKLYEPGRFGDTKKGEEITTPLKLEKSFGQFSCLFKHKGVWYLMDVSHRVQHDKFVKKYPGEKYYGTKIRVQQYNVTE